jgi:hypothetical protein
VVGAGTGGAAVIRFWDSRHGNPLSNT